MRDHSGYILGCCHIQILPCFGNIYIYMFIAQFFPLYNLYVYMYKYIYSKLFLKDAKGHSCSPNLIYVYIYIQIHVFEFMQFTISPNLVTPFKTMNGWISQHPCGASGHIQWPGFAFVEGLRGTGAHWIFELKIYRIFFRGVENP